MTHRLSPLSIAALFLALAASTAAHASSHGVSGHGTHGTHGNHGDHGGQAGQPAADTADQAASATPSPSAPDTELARGEVVRWDPSAGKLTLRHGELKNLAMPPMTMVFRLQAPNPALALTPGTPVRFRAEDQRGALVITRIEAER